MGLIGGIKDGIKDAISGMAHGFENRAHGQTHLAHARESALHKRQLEHEIQRRRQLDDFIHPRIAEDGWLTSFVAGKLACHVPSPLHLILSVACHV